MILTRLVFERNRWSEAEMNKPLKGRATFSGSDNEIIVGLNEEQAHKILLICEESIRESIEEGIKSMHTSLLEGVSNKQLT